MKNNEQPDQAHAVRWSMPASGIIDHLSKWHWTIDGNRTACGRIIRIIGGGRRLLPETDDSRKTVTCRTCNTRINSRSAGSVSRRFVCKICGAKSRHSKNARGSEPVCGACNRTSGRKPPG